MNPWSEAAASAKTDHNVSLEQQPIRSSRREVSTCGLSTLRSLVKLWHILDALMGVILTVYGLSLLSSHLYLPICLILGMGVLLCMRSMAGLSGLSTDLMQRCGLRVSGAYLSPLFAIFFFLVSCMCMGNNHAFITYLHDHCKELHLPSIEWLEQHHHALWVTFFVAALVEMIRWWIIPRLHQWLVDIDTHMDSIVATPITTPRRKPWWWQQHDHQTDTAGSHLHDPLLENDYHWAHPHNQSYTIHDGISQQDTSFWSKWFGSVREEEVSFQSVQEEWASKSEEDPFWWSREEEEPTTRTKKESWTKETLNQENKNASI